MHDQFQILLVEDDPASASLIRELLAHVVHADRLGTALELLRQRHFDAVLLDLGLPDGSGLEVLAAVRERAPELPVIVLTGNEDEQLPVQAVQQGAQDYLTKDQIAAYPPLLQRSIRYAIERQRILLVAAQVDPLRERERQLRCLNEMGEFLHVCQSVEEAYRVIVRAGGGLFAPGSDAKPELGGGLGVLDASGNMVARGTWGGLAAEVLCCHRRDCWALRRGRAHLNL
ncbi:MAG: response regulator, partial [Terriglobales bacterium]